MRFIITISITLFYTMSIMCQSSNILSLRNGMLLNDKTNAKPNCNLQFTDDGVLVTYQFDKAKVSYPDSDSKKAIWNYDGFIQTEKDGLPMLPQHTDIFFIEKGLNIYLELVDAQYEEYDFEPFSSSNPILENLQSHKRLTDTEINSNIEYEEQAPIKMGELQYRRNAQLISIIVSPVLFNNDKRTIRAYHTLTYRLNYSFEATNETLQPISMKEYEDLCTVATPLHEFKNIYKANGDIVRTPPGYLIFSTPDFKDATEKLAEWKRCIGYNVVCLYSDHWDQSSIKTKVQYYYNNEKWLGKRPLGDSQLEYVLFIGTSSFIEANSHDFITDYETVNYLSDMDYFCMDGVKDNLPDIYYGRILVTYYKQANIIINKIINYERNGVTNSNSLKDAIYIAGFWDEHTNIKEGDYISDGYEDTPFVETTETIRQALKDEFANSNYVYRYKGDSIPTNWTKFPLYCNSSNPGATLPEYMLSDDFNWEGEASDIKKYWEKGASLVFLRNHGIDGICGNPNFVYKDAADLNNGDNLPFVIACSCESAKLNRNAGIIQTSMANPDGGSIGGIGASSNSYSRYNDEFMYALSHLLFPQKGIRSILGSSMGLNTWAKYSTPIRNPSKLMDLSWILARSHLQQFPEYIDYSRRTYHCIGDPSLNIYIGGISKVFFLDVTRTEEGVYVKNSEGTEGYYTFYNTKNKETINVHSVKEYMYETPYADYVVVSFKKENSITKLNIGQNASLTYIK